MSSANSIDLEQTVRQYLAQFAHVGCGGQPVTMAQYNQLGCSLCKYRAPWNGKLGDAVRAMLRTGTFRNLVVK